MDKKIVVGIVAAVVVVGGAAAYFFKLQADAAKWKEAKEIVEESLTSEGVTRTARFVSVIDGSPEKVLQAIWDVENSSSVVENIKLSELVQAEGNRKVVKMQLQALTLPLQHYTMQFDLDRAAQRVTFKTIESQAQDIEGFYQLEGSPDGTKTRLVYESKARAKVAVPFPESVLEGATRETFVNTVRGVNKSLKAG